MHLAAYREKTDCNSRKTTRRRAFGGLAAYWSNFADCDPKLPYGNIDTIGSQPIELERYRVAQDAIPLLDAKQETVQLILAFDN